MIRWAVAPLAVLALGLFSAGPLRAQPPQDGLQHGPQPARPAQSAVGLVLSGGGARGLAHIGVLKVLERERIPVDGVAGTSMGAIVGGLYASGMGAAELERELLALDWAEIFAPRVDRPHLSQRRKEEDLAFSTAVELGLREGQLRAPQGTVSSRGLEQLLRRLTLKLPEPVRFEQLPTPFLAVATDMESGEMRVLRQGDLAQALRASMSVPGLFAPTEWEGRLLGDGGLVNNLPVDVTRSMGAKQLIAVNVGTPLAPRSALNTLVGVTTQMVSILTEQNVRRSLAALWEDDLLITPQLGGFAATDFEQARAIVAAGEAAANALLPRLQALALSPAAYAQWQQQRQHLRARLAPEAEAPRLAAIRFEGSARTRPARSLTQLGSRAGGPFSVAQAEEDVKRLLATGDYARVDFRLERDSQTLVFELEDKPWGPNYLRVGLDLSTDAAGAAHFNLRLSHNRHWANDWGAEWRNQLNIGHSPRLFSEWYQPLDGRDQPTRDLFAAAWGELGLRHQALFDAGGLEAAQLRRKSATSALEIGQPWGRWGEVRLGAWQQSWQWEADLSRLPLDAARLQSTQRITGWRGLAQVDTLDDANFPRHGLRTQLSGLLGQQRGGGGVQRWEFEFTQAFSPAHTPRDTLNLHLRAGASRQAQDPLGGVYTLGGYQQLSGLRKDQLSGNAMLLARLGWYRRLSTAPVFTRGWFVGGSLEAGNTWSTAGALRLGGLRWAGSAFIGADTGLGPLYLALGSARQGSTAVYLFIGRP